MFNFFLKYKFLHALMFFAISIYNERLNLKTNNAMTLNEIYWNFSRVIYMLLRIFQI